MGRPPAPCLLALPVLLFELWLFPKVSQSFFSIICPPPFHRLSTTSFSFFSICFFSLRSISRNSPLPEPLSSPSIIHSDSISSSTSFALRVFPFLDEELPDTFRENCLGCSERSCRDGRLSLCFSVVLRA